MSGQSGFEIKKSTQRLEQKNGRKRVKFRFILFITF